MSHAVWLEQAEDDLKAAHVLSGAGHHSQAIWLASQAVEKGHKAILVALGLRYEDKHFKKLGHSTDGMTLDGEVAAAYGGGQDATAAARLVFEFGKKLTNRVQILGGIFEGKIVDKAAMEEIATIPSMQVLRGMFANVINSPRTRFAIVLSKVAETKTN